MKKERDPMAYTALLQYQKSWLSLIKVAVKVAEKIVVWFLIKLLIDQFETPFDAWTSQCQYPLIIFMWLSNAEKETGKQIWQKFNCDLYSDISKSTFLLMLMVTMITMASIDIITVCGLLLLLFLGKFCIHN